MSSLLLRAKGAIVAAAFLFVLVPIASGQDPFAEGVRTTEPLTPDEERVTFTLPRGFRIELVAAEPAIHKPMNVAFDARGRLWVTDSIEYPFAAPADRPGRDSVKVLEDRDQDGSFETITTFADGLNIPIGVYPTLDGCIVFSIPNIWYLRDTDGDGRADERTPLYGPMGWERDTHGMNNSFTRHFDGWLYACHGFNNDTTVAGRDGHTIRMQSGNTYRMRLDGERVEQFTWGQVNPFGMTIDRLGNLFTADCHSKPVYQLVRGGYYPSFGKPHDGLGFVPPIMEHLHGSTAIAGVAILDDPDFPEEFRGNLVSGNVMTSRLNRNRLDVRGASRIAVEQPDFLSTTDPWFRPVDVKLGPDGALYVCDFYNRIIGHYEVPLTHPGRDRERGRLWRISRTVEPGHPARFLPDMTRDSDDQIIVRLASDNTTERLLALNLLLDRHANRLPDAARNRLAALLADSRAPERARAAAAWGLRRSGAPITELLTLAGRDRSTAVPLPELETHLARIASEAPIDADPIIDFLARSLRSESRDVRAAAADAVASAARRRADGSPSDAIDRSDAFLPVLLDSLIETAEDDPMLRQGLRIAIKETLRGWPSERLPQLLGKDVRRRSELASVALAVPTEVGAAVLHEAAIGSDLGESQVEAWRRIAAHGAPELLERLPTEIPARFADDPGVQFELLAAVQRGLRDRGLAARSMLADWGRTLATTLLDENAAQGGWTNAPIPGAARRENPWTLERRRSADEVETDFLTTLAVGESSVGRLRSPRFVAAERFEFWCAGHCGYPDRPFAPKNFIRLIDANDGSVLIESTPPRNDVAQRIEWETSAFAGREVRFEAIDADEAGAYAWLSVGRFDPKLLPAPGTPSDTAERVVRGALLIRELGLVDLRSLLLAQVEGAEIDGQARTAAVEACAAVRPDPVVALIAPWIGSGRVGETWRQRSLARLASGPAEEQEAETEARRALIDPLLVSLDATEQGTLAERGVASAEGLALLVDLWERGRLSTRMLGNRQFLDRATAIADPAQRQQIEGWQSLLPPLDEAIAMTLADRREAFRSRGGSSQRGAEVFGKHCAACHQIAGQGAVVGPQLDGVGLRGLERLSEDLLDPNRNVDVAFRPTIVETEDGSTLSGLIRSENGSTVVLVDSLGKEIVVDVASIVQRQPSTLSLMPETLGRDLPEQELLDLFAYLLDQKQAVER